MHIKGSNHLIIHDLIHSDLQHFVKHNEIKPLQEVIWFVAITVSDIIQIKVFHLIQRVNDFKG